MPSVSQPTAAAALHHQFTTVRQLPAVTQTGESAFTPKERTRNELGVAEPCRKIVDQC